MASIWAKQLRWNLTPAELVSGAQEAAAKLRAVYDRITSLAPSTVNVATALSPVIAAELEYASIRAQFEFPQHVSESKEIRRASHDAAKFLSNFDVEQSMRTDLYETFSELNRRITEESAMGVSGEETRYLGRVLRDARRNGLNLSAETRSKIQKLKDEISLVSLEFSKNMNEENTSLLFSEQELAGLPRDLLESLEQNAEGLRRVTLKYPHYYPAMQTIHDPKTRRTLERAFNSRCSDANGPLLERLSRLRHDLAQLVGYPNYTKFSSEILMAQCPKRINDFLATLCIKLELLVADERRSLLALKERDCKARGIPSDGQINAWDLRYYINQYEQAHFHVDQQELRAYFPIDVVTKGLLEIYQRILGVTFERDVSMPSWHPDVLAYAVTDTETTDLLGHFYLDLHPREGKYGHAACFGLQPSAQRCDGSRQTAVAAMVANFSKGAPGKPSLLDHSEVQTYFHEFGHVMHHVCSRTQLAKFSGMRVEADFVEVPSQTLENWCWESKSLAMMSKHHETGEPIPAEKMSNLIASRVAMAGLLVRRQIALASFDQAIHTHALKDLDSIYRILADQMSTIPTSEGTHFPATFEHVAGGYAARYYGYLWSEVYAADIFETIFKADVLSPTAGKAYRTKILERGGSMDGMEMLVDMLGREPTQDAFLRSRGLNMPPQPSL